jgi:mannose-1-phosphate guanylyltransferase
MFVEKPSIEAAKKIIASGALWSTKVMVFATKTFLSIIEHAAPELYRSFEPVQDAIGTPDEQLVIEQVYQNLPPLDFSKDVLEALPFEHRSELVVLPVRGVNWSDWGTSDRLSNTLRQMGFRSYAQPDCVSSQQRNVRLSSKERPAAITRIH